MSSAKIKAGEAQVRVSLTGNLRDGLRRAGRSLARFGANVARVGAGISTAMAAAGAASVAKFASVGAELQKISTQTGATVEELSRLQFAAKKLRIDPDDLTGAIEELNIRIGETVRDGVGPAAEAFAQLGLDAGELARMPVAERIAAISQALAGIKSNTKRGFLADEIFGGDAFKILPLIAKGADGIRELADEADRLGATVTAAQAAAAAELMVAWFKVKAVIGGLINTIGYGLTETMLAMVDLAMPKLMELKEFFENSGADQFAGSLKNAASAFDFVMKAFAAIKKVFLTVRVALNSTILVAIRAFEMLVDGISSAIEAVAKRINKMERFTAIRIDVEDWGVSDFLEAMGDETRRAIADDAEAMLKLDREMKSPLAEAFEEAVAKRQEAAKAMNAAAAKQAAGMVEEGPEDRFEDIVAMIRKASAAAGEAAAGVQSRLASGIKQLAEVTQTGAAGSFSAAAASMLGQSADVDQKQLEAAIAQEQLLAKIHGLLRQAPTLVWGQ